MARPVIVKIELESGKQIEHYSSLKIVQDLFRHNQFELAVPFEVLEDGHFFNHSHEDLCGKTVTFSFQLDDETEDESELDYRFKGLITEICLLNDGDLSNSFLIRGQSPTILLEDMSTKRSFQDMSIQDIFSQILNAYPGNVLDKSLNANSSSSIPYIVQYNETNFDFLNRLAALYGEWFFYDGQVLQLGKETSEEIDFNIDGSQSFKMSISLKPSKQKISGYDYSADKTYSNDNSGKSVDGLNEFGKFALDASDDLFNNKRFVVAEKPINSQSDIDDFGKLQRSVLASELIVVRGTGEVPNITIGSVIKVNASIPQKGGRSKRQNFGTYRITEITHLVDDDGNYTNQFKAVPESVNFPPANPYVKFPVGQTELAKIVDNKDPDNLGRVKVSFFWPGEDNNESSWIRVGTFYAGNNESKGMFFVPEVDAQVLIAYELNNPDYPYVLTSLYAKKSGTRKMADDNSEKYIYTQAGNQIVFYDKDDDKRIEITNENKTDTIITISFKKDKGAISIKTDGSVEIDANENITLKAQKKISIQGNEIEITGQQSLKCDGGTSSSVKGSEVKIEADTNVEVKGGAQAKISSPVTEVSADGVLTVKGALVKIN